MMRNAVHCGSLESERYWREEDLASFLSHSRCEGAGYRAGDG